MGSIALPAFVSCTAEPHIGETRLKVIEQKRRDTYRHGWSRSAYGGMGKAHPETDAPRIAAHHALPRVPRDASAQSSQHSNVVGLRVTARRHTSG